MRATRLSLVAFAAAGLISAGAFAQSQSQSNQGTPGMPKGSSRVVSRIVRARVRPRPGRDRAPSRRPRASC